LDKDNSGFLENAELGAVVAWMLDVEKTPNADKEALKVTMMARIDGNKDGMQTHITYTRRQHTH